MKKKKEKKIEPERILSGAKQQEMPIARSEKPAMWLYIRISDGKIYRVAAEKISEIMVEREMSGVLKNINIREAHELMHFPQVLIDWMTNNLEWADVMPFAMQTYPSKLADPAIEWKTCPKGVLFEGDEL